MTSLDDIKAELFDANVNTPRSKQVESGASDYLGCRAESLFRLTGQPQTDPHLSWQSEVGSAIHGWIEASAGPGIITERRYRYRGIPCTVDRVDPKTKTLTDVKTKDDAAAIAKVQKYGPRDSQVGQIHLGAAAYMEETGEEILRVELLFLPRAGSLDSAWLWGEPFSREKADAAADWLLAEAERARLLVRSGGSLPLTAVEVVEEIDDDELRDQDPLFCYSYCPFVTACRGEREPQVTDLDDITDAAAAKHMEGKLLVDQGQAQMAEVRHYLEGLRGNSAHHRVMTSGGAQKVTWKEDLEELRKTYKFVYGDDADIPIVEETYTTPVRLTVKPRKDSQ